jgi:hypothetical protein
MPGLAQPVSSGVALPLMALQNNIDRLTRTHSVPVQLENGPEKSITIDRPPLLAQLAAAVVSSQTTGGQGGGLASERNVLDASAMMLNDAIRQSVERMWAAYTDRPLPRNLVNAVRVWNVRYRREVRDAQMDADTIWKTVRRTDSWIKQIDLKFDPPITMEMTRPCPNCGHQHGYNSENDRVHAVVITWQKSFDQSVATCRVCNKSWYGENELRQLRWEIDQNDTMGTDRLE